MSSSILGPLSPHLPLNLSHLVATVVFGSRLNPLWVCSVYEFDGCVPVLFITPAVLRVQQLVRLVRTRALQINRWCLRGD